MIDQEGRVKVIISKLISKEFMKEREFESESATVRLYRCQDGKPWIVLDYTVDKGDGTYNMVTEPFGETPVYNICIKPIKNK